MSEKNNETVYLNSCDILIESINLKSTGTYYLVWKKGKKHTQSNKYQLTNDKTFSPKEVLSLSLKVYQQGSTTLPRHTHLILYNGKNEEIDRAKIMIHEWTHEFKQMTMTLGQGTLKLKVKRKSLMKLQKFHRLRSQVEQTSQDQKTRFLIKSSLQGSHEKEQNLKLSKNVEDMNFLVAKITEQRNLALIKIQKLETELSQVNDKMSKDLRKLREYYQLKIEMRQSVYKEEIQQLITSFNKNYELNYSILQNLIKQKMQCEKEIVDLNQSNQEYIAEQEQNFARIMDEMENHKQLIDAELKDSNQKLKQRQQTITELNDELDSLNQQHSHLQQQKKQIQLAKQQQNTNFTNIIKEKQERIVEFTAITQTDKEHIKRIEDDLIHKEDQITNFNKLFEDNLAEKQQLNKFNVQLTNKYEILFQQNEFQKTQFEKQGIEMQELNSQMKKMKDQYQTQLQHLLTEMKQHQDLAKQGVDNQKAINNQLTKRCEELIEQNQKNKMNIEQMTHQIHDKDQQIHIFQTQMESQGNLINNLQNQLTDNLEAFKHRQQELTDRLTQYISRSTELQVFNTQLKGDLREMSLKNHEQVQKMRQQYDKMIESNRRLYDDQLQLLKKERETQSIQYDTMKNDYEKELQQMMSHQKNELDELDRAFKDELQQKTKQNYELLQKFTKINDEFQDFKQKIHLDEMKKENDKEMEKKRFTKKHRWNTEQIDQQEEDDDEHMETVEIQSEQDEPIVPKKKKKINSKKKLMPIRAESTYYEQEEEQNPYGREGSDENIQIVIDTEEEAGDRQAQQQQNSIVQLLKKKKHAKPVSKLKIKKSNQLQHEHLLSQQKQEEEETDRRQQSQLSLKKTQQIYGSFGAENSLEDKSIQHRPSILKKKIKEKTSLDYSQHRISTDKLLQNQSDFDIDEFQRIKQQMQSKIETLEDEISNLKKNQKKMKAKFQKDQKKYVTQIQELETQIAQLNFEKEEISNKLAEQTKKLRQQGKNRGKGRDEVIYEKSFVQISQPKSPRTPRSPKTPTLLKNLTHSERKIQDKDDKSQKSQKSENKSPSKDKYELNEKRYKNKITDLQITIEQKQRKIARLQNNIRQLEKELQQGRKYALERGNMEESKIIYKTGNEQRSMSFADPQLKMSIANLQVKVSSQKQRYHELKLRHEQMSRQYNSLQDDFKKAKRNIEQLEEKVKRSTVSRSVQQIQSELDDCNRKILELSRSVNQTRLEKDSLQDEIRIVRKKLSEVSKTNLELQSKVSQLERQNDDLKRKEQKLKREIDQWQQEGKRLKEQAKNTLQELAETRKSQSQFVIQRKRVLDEVVRLQGIIAQKQTEMIRNNKQNQKLRGRINDGQSNKKQRDKSLHVELQKLQIERSQLERKNRESEQTIKMLKEKMQIIEKESKRALDERKQTYSQKLKQYISEVMSVKKVVEEFQQENTRLKLQNSEFFQQNEIIKMSFEKQQIKYQELIYQENQISEEASKLQHKVSELKQILKKKGFDQEKIQIVLTTLRKQLDSERVASRKKTQKLQSFEQINQRYLYEIKTFKIKLNEYQGNANQNTKLNEQVYNSQRTIDSLQQQLQKISEQYSEHSNRYVYTKEDVDSALKELKEHQDRVKEEQFMKIIEQFDKNNSNQRQKMQNELIQLYSENEKLRSSLQKSAEEALQLQLQFAQIQTLRDKNKRIEKERNSFERKNIQILDELKLSRQQIRRIQIKYNDSIRNQEGKSTEIVVLMQKYDDLNKRYQQVSQSYNELKIQDKKILEKYKAANEEKQRNIQTLAVELQNLNNKLMASQLQVSRLKDMESYYNKDYAKKIKQLQDQIQLINEHNKQHDSQRQLLHKGQIKELKIKISKYQADLQDKLNRIQELNEGVVMLQREVQQITDELTNSRTQLAEDGEYYTIQINKLRNQMRQMEETYEQTIRNLEQELSAMSKQLTSLKFARQTNNSRLKMSRLSEGGDDKSSKKYEERLKFKDRRIQELKQTVIALEQKLGDLMRKQGKNNELDALKIKYAEFQKLQKQIIDKKTQQYSRINDQYKRLKEDLPKYKNQIQQLTLRLEQKEMEIQSQKSEILTTNMLYSDLQKEVDKRKDSLNIQIKQESSLKLELQTKNKQIEFLSRQIEQVNSEITNYQTALKKKTLQNRNLSQINQKLQKDKAKLLDLERNKLEGQNFAKLKIKQVQSEIQSLKGQNRRLKNELNFALKQNDKMKSELNNKNANIIELVKQIEINDKKISDSQNFLSKFVGLNQQCINKMGISLEQLLGWSMQTRQSLDFKQEQLIKLNDELEELRFLEQRKLLDFEQLKKQNYQLVLKTEEREINYQQLQQMSEKIIELSRDRQDLLFREEAIKVQLNNICSNLTNDKSFERQEMRTKIQNIINDNYI